MTFERFMDLSLYHPEFGYYATSPRLTGRGGDFFTSVDVGPLFGELLARQFAEMHDVIRSPTFDLVEAAAGDGRLARDVLDALEKRSRPVYDVLRLHLVDASSTARAVQPLTLGRHAKRLVASSDTLPERVTGVIFANELLDALPCHAVTMTSAGLRETMVAVEGVDGGELVERDGPPSTPALAAYLERAGVRLESGWRAEINLRAVEWVREAARRLVHGFLILIDYGHEAVELYSSTHSAGTRASHSRHVSGTADSRPAWLIRPGEVDITAHVDLTTIRRAAEAEGLTTIAILDQTYFLLGLGLADDEDLWGDGNVKRRLALKTLVLPGGLGSTLKVLIFGRGVGTPSLLGCSYGTRLT
jgi:SAM-dependent MidA family methyltransferase